MAHSSLRGHHKLLRLTTELDCDNASAIGRLQLIWWTVYHDSNVGEDGKLIGWDRIKIADVAEWPGDPEAFVKAMVASGFIDHGTDGTYSIHHLSQSAPEFVKRRWRRQAKSSDRTCPTVTVHDRTCPDMSDKQNRTEQNTSKRRVAATPPAPDSDKKPKLAKPRKPDPIWDAVADLCCPGGNLTPGDKKRIGRLTADLKTKQATPDEIRVRLGRAQRQWPEMTVTLNAVVKHWDALAHDPATVGSPGVVKPPKDKYKGR